MTVTGDGWRYILGKWGFVNIFYEWIGVIGVGGGIFWVGRVGVVTRFTITHF